MFFTLTRLKRYLNEGHHFYFHTRAANLWDDLHLVSWIGSTELWVLTLSLAFKYPIMSCLPGASCGEGARVQGDEAVEKRRERSTWLSLGFVFSFTHLRIVVPKTLAPNLGLVR